MKTNFYIYFFALGIILSGCDKKDDVVNTPFVPPDSQVVPLPANCNVELVEVVRITAAEVAEGAEIGDYFFTLKSVKTEKSKISIEGRYAKDGAAAAIVTITYNGSVGIDETIAIKVSSSDINTEEDFNCMEYVVKVEADGVNDCEYVGTDC